MKKIVHIPVDKVQIEGLQARAEINQDVVREYAEAATTGGATLPPIVVFRDELKNFWVGDGIHRLAAAKNVGQKMIAADVRDGTRTDALRYALGANGLHGLRRTAADKAHAVKMAYEHRSELGLPDVPAANLIAGIVGVSDTFVTNQLLSVGSWSQATARTGADGRTRELPPIPTRRPALKAAAAAETPRTAGPAAPPYLGDAAAERCGYSKTDARDRVPPERGAPTSGGPTEGSPAKPELPPVPTRRRAAPPAAPSDAGPVDERGRHIPEDLLPVWNRRQEVQDAATAISRLKSLFHAAQDGHDPLWNEINFSSLLNYLERAYTEISAAKPWCVCPMCQGIGCRACKGGGLMGKYRFDNAVASEFKK